MKGKVNFLISSCVAILLSLTVGAIVIALLGKNPFTVYWSLLQGSGLAMKPRYAGSKSMLTDFLSFVDFWVPMIFAALAVAVALKAGLFNIGVSGQMLAAGFVASITVGYSKLDGFLAKPLVLIVALLVGGVAGGIIGLLKYQFQINEVVSSIMINYILEYVVSFFIYNKFFDPISRQLRPISEASRLTIKNVVINGWKCDIPLGILGAILTVGILRYVMFRTSFGFALRAVGVNRKASLYAGIKVGKKIVQAMVISGALAGVAGAAYYLGYYASIQPRTLSTVGFDAVAVSLLGNADPFGIFLTSFLISVIGKGSTYMSARTGLDGEAASVLIGLILLFSACGRIRRKRR